MSYFQGQISEAKKDQIVASMSIASVPPSHPESRSFEASISREGDQYQLRIRQEVVAWGQSVSSRAGTDVATLLSYLTSLPTSLATILGWSARETSAALKELRHTLKSSGVFPKDYYEESKELEFLTGLSLPEGVRGKAIGKDRRLQN